MDARTREWNNVIGCRDVGTVTLCEQLPAVLETLTLDQTAQGQDRLPAGEFRRSLRTGGKVVGMHGAAHITECTRKARAAPRVLRSATGEQAIQGPSEHPAVGVGATRRRALTVVNRPEGSQPLGQFLFKSVSSSRRTTCVPPQHRSAEK